MTSVAEADVERAVRSLAARRSYIKPRHVARELGVDADAHRSIGHRLSALADEGMVERWSNGDSINGTTWQLLVDEGEPAIRTDGGRADDRPQCGIDGCGRDADRELDTDPNYLCRQCFGAFLTGRATAFDDGSENGEPDEPTVRADGGREIAGHDLEALYQTINAVHTGDDEAEIGDYRAFREDSWNGAPVEHVIVDYDTDPNWWVIPDEFVGVVLSELDRRVSDVGEGDYVVAGGDGR
ncbi:hypothetical protein HZS55_15715 [Halosimplex rubrum]|uniref:Uncharacterized protein n=1 Tax=Halosimplex rubrum TaxID=869889 RepID=A0A7D5P1Q2_9EURY|nr:hypothetical protein [Halosimplex rubrum]QLH78646.1 hypothetical protein HZS55_15715 [Halosimplex rubrum]